jgi:hypothetical protein
METEKIDVRDLSLAELKGINAGNPVIIFIAGAILGGIIYDVYKTASLALIKVQIEHPEYYDGAVHSER